MRMYVDILARTIQFRMGCRGSFRRRNFGVGYICHETDAFLFILRKIAALWRAREALPSTHESLQFHEENDRKHSNI